MPNWEKQSPPPRCDFLRLGLSYFSGLTMTMSENINIVKEGNGGKRAGWCFCLELRSLKGSQKHMWSGEMLPSLCCLNEVISPILDALMLLVCLRLT